MALVSLNEITTFRWSFEDDVQHYAAARLDGIAVWRQKLSDYGEEKGVELLGESGLGVSSLLWAGGFTGSDGRTYRESVEDALDAVTLAAELRAESLIVYSGARGGHTGNHARRLFRQALEELTPAAAESGLRLAVEPMHAGCADGWTYLTGLDETLELLESVSSPQVALALDAYHLGHEAGLLARIPQIVARIAVVQLGDARGPPRGEQNRCRLGDGELPLREIVRALATSGYDGYYEIELLGEDVERVDYHELIDHSQRVCRGWLSDVR